MAEPEVDRLKENSLANRRHRMVAAYACAPCCAERKSNFRIDAMQSAMRASGPPSLRSDFSFLPASNRWPLSLSMPTR
jgi:hypothetical protein